MSARDHLPISNAHLRGQGRKDSGPRVRLFISLRLSFLICNMELIVYIVKVVSSGLKSKY